MADPDADRDGLREGLESSHGDPRVLLVLNAVLSTLFAWILVAAGDFVGMLEFSLTTVAAVAAGVFVLTFVMTRS
ncbi:hypothetical protein [Natronococcus wangiae]|uniref:hypothetical protein n=1 Tax=Natronococcus wangiae TaxID=3068275 RepID=UPI00273E53E7|nr:hypothetical protein [Natronococcus sp. AD5]